MPAEAYLISADSGEIIQEIEEGSRIRVYTDEDKFIPHKDDRRSNERFVKLYTDNILILKNKLSAPEFAFMICLSPLVCFDTCAIRMNGIRNGKCLDVKEIAEYTGYEYEHARKIIRKLINRGVMARIEVGNVDTNKPEKIFVMNPYIFRRGTQIDKKVESYFFDNSGWKELVNNLS